MIDQLNYNARVSAWIRQHPDLPTLESRSALYRYIQSVIVGNDAIDLMEFGVYKGDSIREWCELNKHPESRFLGFDSFQGLPEIWSRCPPGMFSTDGVQPDIDDPRLHFVAGLFQDTLKPFLRAFTPRNRIVINNDSDLYSSTLYCLSALDSVLIPGSIIIFDEYYSGLHEFRAFGDFCGAFRRDATPLARVNDEHGRVAFILE
jgi:hypothetical protein